MPPWKSFVPDLVVRITWPPGVRPNSGANEDVSIRNSCKASTETRLLVPPNALNPCVVPIPDPPGPEPGLTPKFAETPSTLKLLASVLCPAMLNCPGELKLLDAITTPGVS